MALSKKRLMVLTFCDYVQTGREQYYMYEETEYFRSGIPCVFSHIHRVIHTDCLE